MCVVGWYLSSTDPIFTDYPEYPVDIALERGLPTGDTIPPPPVFTDFNS